MTDITSQYLAQGAIDPTYQLKHVLSQTRPIVTGKPVFGLPNVGVGAGNTMAVYNAVAVPKTTRTRRLRSEQEISTELYGTAPYLGQGDGIALHPEVSTALRNSRAILRGDKTRYLITERPPNRWEFIKEPTVVQPVLDQIGVSSRMDAVYK